MWKKVFQATNAWKNVFCIIFSWVQIFLFTTWFQNLTLNERVENPWTRLYPPTRFHTRFEIHVTLKSLSEALIFASINPRFDNRLLVSWCKNKCFWKRFTCTRSIRFILRFNQLSLKEIVKCILLLSSKIGALVGGHGIFQIQLKFCNVSIKNESKNMRFYNFFQPWTNLSTYEFELSETPNKSRPK